MERHEAEEYRRTKGQDHEDDGKRNSKVGTAVKSHNLGQTIIDYI
jgi:hypothetical protein